MLSTVRVRYSLVKTRSRGSKDRRQLGHSEIGEGVSVAFLRLEEVFPVIFPLGADLKKILATIAILFFSRVGISKIINEFLTGWISQISDR